MKSLVIALCMLASACSGHQYGYVVFDFYYVPDNSRKDYWLGIENLNRGFHLPSKKPIHRIPSGNYVITHLDRTANHYRTRDDLRLEERNYIEVQIDPDMITYLGVFTLKETDKAGNFTFKVSSGAGLMRRACTYDSELVDTYRVKLALMTMKSGNEFKYDCKTGLADL
ncbi:hypothetical protein [Microbulbifer aggregans]|uniref:hypothetical protein n=1 Tax=Microbulbifer aggregans TaxID=1769779 RepID=UPI001CFE47B5|nr:hypothetical protein [Microbulbifer aggregans]